MDYFTRTGDYGTFTVGGGLTSLLNASGGVVLFRSDTNVGICTTTISGAPKVNRGGSRNILDFVSTVYLNQVISGSCLCYVWNDSYYNWYGSGFAGINDKYYGIYYSVYILAGSRHHSNI